MTTAHRATYNPAKGGTARGEGDLGKLSKQYSSRDLPSHTKLKYRQSGQNAPDEISRRDLRRELEDRERTARSEKRSEGRSRESSKKQKMEPISTASLDADDPVDSGSDSDSSEDNDEDLYAELKQIRKERAEEAARAEQEKKEEEERIRTENILSGNPLINPKGTSSFAVKRRWDDDVVFKNCARGQLDKPKQNFINDTLRSEFHKKFMDKYVK